jgi:mono/diheme cytochrome c family protein
MAQESPTPPELTEQTEAKGRDNRFHYYSGGEVKEIEGTRVSPVLWGFWTVVIIGAVGYFLFGGALGPSVGGFKPVGGSKANLNSLQADLNAHESAAGVSYASVDLNQLPIPPGQNITQAIAAGTTVYQSYCIGCHGPNQDGNGVNAQELNPKPRNLRDAPFMQSMSYQRITTSVHKGVPGTAMPRWENLLSENQIADVIAYVFSLTSPAPSASATAAAAKSAGGSHVYVSGIQNSPKPITPPINGNPAAETSTAPPSASGPTPAQTRTMMRAPVGTGSEASKRLGLNSPTAGGSSVTPPFSPGARKPKPVRRSLGASQPGVTSPNPPNSAGGSGM